MSSTVKSIKETLRRSTFRAGVKDGIPIALGYLSVSFGFGIMAVKSGLSVGIALLISMTNLTSAGQVAGIGVIAAGGGLIEMALAQLVINLRYALMSITLSQKADGSFSTLHRMLGSFGITDEIFAVCASSESEFGRRYLYGLILLPYFGWAGGTLLGAIAGSLLPQVVTSALNIAIYGMFIAIVLPQTKGNRGITVVAALAAAFSCVFSYVPALKNLGSGYTVILCGITAAAVGAIFFPTPEEKKAKREGRA